MRLDVKGASWAVAGAQILREVSLTCPSGSFVGVIGPNGSGKSSLLRCIYRVLEPTAGVITVDDQNVWRMSARDMARRAAVVLQESDGQFDFSVREMVLMGRAPHKHLLEGESAGDRAIADEALVRVGMASFRDRSFLTLSGGEKQRVLLARALAQQPSLLVLDEPTNHLDIRHQLELLDLIRDLGITTIAALHDLNLAAWYGDYLYALDRGAVVASGPVGTVLTPTLIRSLYGVDSEVTMDPVTRRPRVMLLPRSRASESAAAR